jgi:hypothetical protein
MPGYEIAHRDGEKKFNSCDLGHMG